jgi:hypothetical protein
VTELETANEKSERDVELEISRLSRGVGSDSTGEIRSSLPQSDHTVTRNAHAKISSCPILTAKMLKGH